MSKISQPSLLATLKRHNPSKVRAYTSDDDHRDIAVPTRRRKWDQVIRAIEALAWSRVEMLDKSGAVLGYVENTEPAGDLQDIADKPGTATDLQRIVQIVLGAIERGVAIHVQARTAEVNAAMEASTNMLREMSAAQSALAGLYREQVQAAGEVATMRAAAEAGDGQGQLKELMEAAPQILSMVPMVKQLFANGANGVRKPPTG